MNPADTSARSLALALAEGALDAQALVADLLAHIGRTDAQIGAWVHLDAEHAMSQARAADDRRRAGLVLGPLHGVPVAVKDIIDTSDLPTEDGTPLHAGRRPVRDATVVSRLRAAGAIILGKTVTTEFAYFAPGPTRNPLDPERTPGGSSSGSAAAVASAMVPLALGTQTNGSIIRPAAYCGVYALKPSFGMVSRHGVLELSKSVDHVGVFATCVEDLALAGDVLYGYDELDEATRPMSSPRLLATALEEPPLTPVLGIGRCGVWSLAEEETLQAFAELAEVLGERCTTFDLPPPIDELIGWHRTVMDVEMAASLAVDFHRGADRMSPQLVTLIGRGRAASAVDYLHSLGAMRRFGSVLDEMFDSFDALVMPSAAGVAPLGLASTGDPSFCTLATALGLPSVNLPLMRGSTGLPLGVQLIGRRGDDARLLRTARWLVGFLARSPADQ